MTAKSKESGKVITFEKIKVACSNCSLVPLCLPMGLESGDIDRLDKIVNRNRPLHKGNRLFSVGDPFHSLYVVKVGSVKSYTQSDNGREQVVDFHLPGELIGLEAIQDNQHHCSASALETTAVCEVPFKRLESLTSKIPGLQHQVFKFLSKELSKDANFRLMMGNNSSEERVAWFLVSISNRLHHRHLSSTNFVLSMSRQEIGSYLCLALETVSRIFTKLQDEKIIKVDRKHIEILNLGALHDMVSTNLTDSAHPSDIQGRK